MNNIPAREFYALVGGGSILTINAGIINAVTLSTLKITVSHVTGNVTKTAVAIFEQNWRSAFLVVSLVFAFLLGSFVSGILVGDSKFRLGRRYGMVLLIESGALLISALMLHSGQQFGVYVASFACGLQNAMVTTFSGAVVRTTHMTGIVTDIGMLLGQVLNPNVKADVWKFKVFVPLLVSYFIGNIIGSVLAQHLSSLALLIPCGFTGLTAFVYLSTSLGKVVVAKVKEEVRNMKDDSEILKRWHHELGRDTLELLELEQTEELTGTLLVEEDGKVTISEPRRASYVHALLTHHIHNAPGHHPSHPSPLAPTVIPAHIQHLMERQDAMDKAEDDPDGEWTPAALRMRAALIAAGAYNTPLNDISATGRRGSIMSNHSLSPRHVAGQPLAHYASEHSISASTSSLNGGKARKRRIKWMGGGDSNFASLSNVSSGENEIQVQVQVHKHKGKGSQSADSLNRNESDDEKENGKTKKSHGYRKLHHGNEDSDGEL